jgi:hypothetical protein
MAVVMGVVLLVAILAVGASARIYAAYYDCSGTRDTGLVVMNSGGSDTYYTIKIYDAYGTLLEAVSGDLSAYQSGYHRLSSLIEWGDTTWGLVLIDTPGLLTVGVETFDQDAWLSSDNVSYWTPSKAEYKRYWYGLNYANTSEQATVIVVANPNDSAAQGSLFLYSSLGDLEKKVDFDLEPHEANFYRSFDLLGVEDKMWGVLDVEAPVPLLVAVEYFNADGALLNVDQMGYAYYVE